MSYPKEIREYRSDFARSLSMQVIGVLILAAFVISCGSSNSSGSGCTANNAVATTSVTVKDFSFDPACIKITAGDTVTWTNTGMPTHTVTGDTGAPETFNSGALGTGGTFQHTFTAAETEGYHCIPHEGIGMVGTVIVQ